MTAVELLSPAEATPANARWHELRRAGISASEIPAVLGISPWESPFSVFWRKANGWTTEQSDEMSAGHYAEPAVAAWFADNHDPHESLTIRPAGLYASPERPWALATPDRLIHSACLDCAGRGSGGPAAGPETNYLCASCYGTGAGSPVFALLECKYVIGGWDGWGEPDTDEVPVHYRAQCLWQADVLEVDEVYLAAWHGAEFRTYTIRRDDHDIAFMRRAGAEFMDRLTAGDPPPLDGHVATLRTVKALHPDLDDRDQEVDPDIAQAWREAKERKAAAEAAERRFEIELRAVLGDARRAVVGGEKVATRVISEVAESTRTVAAHRRDYLLAPREEIMTTNTVSQAVEKRDSSPTSLIAAYSNDFTRVLPSHIKPETWVRLAQGALRKGARQGNRFELEIAAANNPGVFLASLLDAARLGLTPGSEEYYLTPRKVGGRLEILGIVGYQGHIELMYRAGAVSSVVAEVVHQADVFRYQPGRDEVPQHEIDWDAEDRGPLRLVYAYARMKDGATSKVIVLNKADIERIKKSSQGSDGKYSPWVNHEASMWLKSSVRQLQKWVPTSAEYRREQVRAMAEAAHVADRTGAPLPAPDAIDADVVDQDDTDWPAVADVPDGD